MGSYLFLLVLQLTIQVESLIQKETSIPSFVPVGVSHFAEQNSRQLLLLACRFVVTRKEHYMLLLCIHYWKTGL